MNGKKRCKILKEIRQKIAKENDIELITSECKHKGDCLGTCPKCEAEVRFLESELSKRSQIGKAITLTGLAFTMASCNPFANQVQGLVPNSPIEDPVPPEEIIELEGDVPFYPEGEENQDEKSSEENQDSSQIKKDEEENKETSEK